MASSKTASSLPARSCICGMRSEEHTSELQSRLQLVCRLLLEKKKNVNLTGSAQPIRLSFKQVAPNYFAVLGVDAQLGRTFDPHDTTPGYNLEVVISDGLWRREFGANPHILDKVLRLDNDAYHVVGVMPRGFRDQGSTSEEQTVELWLGAGFAGIPFPPPLRGS